MELLNNLFSIAIDCGKYNTKAVFENMGIREKLIMRTTFRENHNTVQVFEDIHCVTINGEKFIVGDSADELSEEHLNLDKNSKLHEVATLTMICKALKKCEIKTGSEADFRVNLGINIPLSQYLKADKKAEIESLYANKKFVIEFDGEVFSFVIETVLVLFEGAGVLIQYSEAIKDKNVYIIDCGGLNITRLAIIDGKIDIDTLKTDTRGCNSVISEVIEEVESQFGRKLLASDVMKVLKGEKFIEGKDFEQINALIKKIFEDAIAESVKNIKTSKNIDYHSFEYFMLGGSSSFYHATFASQLNKPIKLSKNPIFDNVEGFYQTMKLKGL